VLVKVKLKAVPWVADAVAALVIAGACWTVKVNVCVVVPSEFVASNARR
jgi:hypothetical protein